MKKYTDENIEAKRKTALVMYVCMIISFIAVTLYMILAKSYNFWIIVELFLIAILTFLTGIVLKIHVTPHLTRILLGKVNTKIKDLEFALDKGIPEKIFRDTNFLKKYVSYKSYNFIAGKVENHDFIFSEAIVRNKTSTSGPNESVVIYKGIFGITDFNNINNIDMVIAPDVKNKFLNSMSEDTKKIFGANKNIVRLENTEFERNFEVYCGEQVDARKIITPRFMENLLRAKEKFGKNLTVIYKGNKIYFFVENKFLVNPLKLFLKGVNQDMINETNETLDILADIVESV